MLRLVAKRAGSARRTTSSRPPRVQRCRQTVAPPHAPRGRARGKYGRRMTEVADESAGSTLAELAELRAGIRGFIERLGGSATTRRAMAAESGSDADSWQRLCGEL